MSFLFCATELVNNYCVHLCHVFDTSYCYCIFSSVFHAVKSSLHGVSCTETTSRVCLSFSFCLFQYLWCIYWDGDKEQTSLYLKRGIVGEWLERKVVQVRDSEAGHKLVQANGDVWINQSFKKVTFCILPEVNFLSILFCFPIQEMEIYKKYKNIKKKILVFVL